MTCWRTLTGRVLRLPEGLVGLELDLARADAQIADRAVVKGGKLAALTGTPAPCRQDLVEGGVGAGQRRLGTVVK